MGFVPEWIEHLPDHPKAEVTDVMQNLLPIVRADLLQLPWLRRKERKAIENMDLPDFDVRIDAPDYDRRRVSLPERVGPLEMMAGLHARLFHKYLWLREYLFQPRFREPHSLLLLEHLMQEQRCVLADVLMKEFADEWLVRAPQHIKPHMEKWKVMTDLAGLPPGILMGVHQRIAGVVSSPFTEEK